MSRRPAQPTHRSSRTRGKRSLLSRVRKVRRWRRSAARRGSGRRPVSTRRRNTGGCCPLQRRLRELGDENGRLKRIVANLTLDRELLQGVLKRSRSRQSEAEQRSEAGSHARDRRRGSGGLAGDDPQSVSGFALRSFDLPLPVLSQRSVILTKRIKESARRMSFMATVGCMTPPGPEGSRTWKGLFGHSKTIGAANSAGATSPPDLSKAEGSIPEQFQIG